MSNRSLSILIGLALVVGLLLFFNARTAQNGEVAPGDAKPGWSGTIQEALTDQARRDPRLIVVTRAGWSGYERSIYEHASIAPLIEPLGRSHVDFESDTARFTAWGIEGAPALALVTADGRLISRLVGARDLSIVKRALEGAIALPIARDELALRTDTPAVIRSAEVAIEIGDFDTAASLTQRFLVRDTASVEIARGRYLHLYAQAEGGDMSGAATMGAEYLKDYPEGADRSAILWILTVIDLQAGRDRVALERISAMREADSGSAYARQAILAYAMEYLARGKNRLADADRYLTQCIDEGSPWTDDLLLARSYLRFANPETVMGGVDDLKRVAQTGGVLGEEAQERLVGFATQGDPALQSQIILFFQDLVRRPGESGSARLRLVRLYLAAENVTRAREEARTLAAGGGEFADDALLLQGVMALEIEFAPAEAAPIFADLIKRFPSRETLWPAKYGLARAHFFGGDIRKSAPILEELITYLEGRRYLPEPFLIILTRPMPPAVIQTQLKDYHRKATDLLDEEKGEVAFQRLMTGVIASSRGDSAAAIAAYQSIIAEQPASSIADDALFEEARLYLRDGRLEEAHKALTRITTSYKNSDQFDAASQFLEALKETRR